MDRQLPGPYSEMTTGEIIIDNQVLKSCLETVLEFKRLVQILYSNKETSQSTTLARYEAHAKATLNKYQGYRQGFSDHLVHSISRLDDSKLTKCGHANCALETCTQQALFGMSWQGMEEDIPYYGTEGAAEEMGSNTQGKDTGGDGQIPMPSHPLVSGIDNTNFSVASSVPNPMPTLQNVPSSVKAAQVQIAENQLNRKTLMNGTHMTDNLSVSTNGTGGTLASQRNASLLRNNQASPGLNPVYRAPFNQPKTGKRQQADAFSPVYAQSPLIITQSTPKQPLQSKPRLGVRMISPTIIQPASSSVKKEIPSPVVIQTVKTELPDNTASSLIRCKVFDCPMMFLTWGETDAHFKTHGKLYSCSQCKNIFTCKEGILNFEHREYHRKRDLPGGM